MKRERRGFALMAALWLVVLIGAVGYDLSVRSRTRRLGVANALEKIRADAAADAGIESARALLEARLTARDRAGAAPDLDPWGALDQPSADTIHVGDAHAVVRIADAGARLNINSATEQELQRFMVARGIDAEESSRIAQRIADWRDTDDSRRSQGMERADYLRSGARTLPVNADFADVESLRDVDGVTPELFATISPYLTTIGNGEVNLNAAPAAVLSSLAGFGDEASAVVLNARAARRPIRSIEELVLRLPSSARNAIVDAGSALATRAVFESRSVAVEATGWLDGGAIRVRKEAMFTRSGDATLASHRRSRQ